MTPWPDGRMAGWPGWMPATVQPIDSDGVPSLCPVNAAARSMAGGSPVEARTGRWGAGPPRPAATRCGGRPSGNVLIKPSLA